MPKILYALPVALFIALSVFYFSYGNATSPVGVAAQIETAASHEHAVLGAYPELEGVRVDINCTEAAQWERLPGIGPKKAEAIVEYVKANAPLASVDALINVKGIGDQTLDKLRPYLSESQKE